MEKEKKDLMVKIVVGLAIFIAAFLIYQNYEEQREVQGKELGAKEIIGDYYSQILNKEKESPGVTLDDKDLEILKNCKKGLSVENTMTNVNECLKEFYEKYTLQHGANQAFAQVRILEKTYPDFVPDCHYIAHGIGHGQLQLSRGDAGAAFAKLSYDNFINNFATCGNGYFHGIIEEYSRDEKTEAGLVKLLKPVCQKSLEGKTSYRPSDCYHGVGHAAFIQLDFDFKKAENVCDQLTDKDYLLYDCYSGIFMQSLADLGAKDLLEVENGVAKYLICEKEESKYQPACYYQHASLLNKFSNEKYNPVKNINFCKQIENEVNRLACVNYFASRAFTDRFRNILPMCENTSNDVEKTICVSVFAQRLSSSLDVTKKSEEYKKSVEKVCGILGEENGKKCVKGILEEPRIVYVPSTTTLEYFK